MRKKWVFLLLMSFLLGIAGCGGTTETVKHDEATSYDQQVEQIIIHWCGKEADKGKPSIREVQINKTFTTDSSQIILAHLNASSNLSSDMIKKNMWVKSRRMFEDFFNLPDTEEVTIFWYYPVEGKDELVMKVNMKKETADEIDWESFLWKNIPKVADDYWQGFKG